MSGEIGQHETIVDQKQTGVENEPHVDVKPGFLSRIIGGKGRRAKIGRGVVVGALTAAAAATGIVGATKKSEYINPDQPPTRTNYTQPIEQQQEDPPLQAHTPTGTTQHE